MKDTIRLALHLLILQSCLALAAAGDLERREWTVDGLARHALVRIPAPAKTKESPLVFVFHGHGGTADRIAARYRYQQTWPEAIVVYPQGLNTPGRLTDPQGLRSGWNMVPAAGNRDLRFFDAMLADLRRECRVDDRRIYATGHSNGGGFTYLLWAARGDVFAAVAPTASVPGVARAAGNVAGLSPKPVLHLAGEKDQLVRFEWQQQTMAAIRGLNTCGEGVPWGPKYCTLYPSPIGAPVVTYIHPGGHQFPVEAAPVIQKFFQMHRRGGGPDTVDAPVKVQAPRPPR